LSGLETKGISSFPRFTWERGKELYLEKNTKEDAMNLAEHEIITNEIRALLKDTNERINKMAAERMRSSEKWRKEFDANNAAWEKRSKAIDKKIDKVAGLFDTQWGKLIESLVEGGVLNLFQDRGVRVTEVHPRAKSHRNGDTMEVDLLLVNEYDVVVIEVKTTLKVKHVRHFLKRMDKFFTFFPRYKEQTVFGGVAALRIEQEADRYAAKQGLFALQVGGDGLVKFLNDEAFKARNFG
jgi:hypothetical protein